MMRPRSLPPFHRGLASRPAALEGETLKPPTRREGTASPLTLPALSQHFTNRFSGHNRAAQLSGSPTNWWYSWNHHSGGAKIHFVAVSTEVYYFDEAVPALATQWHWLDEVRTLSAQPDARFAPNTRVRATQDLARARAEGADWIIMYGHRPMYCSNVDDLPDCSARRACLPRPLPPFPLFPRISDACVRISRPLVGV